MIDSPKYWYIALLYDAAVCCAFLVIRFERRWSSDAMKENFVQIYEILNDKEFVSIFESWIQSVPQTVHGMVVPVNRFVDNSTVF